MQSFLVPLLSDRGTGQKNEGGSRPCGTTLSTGVCYITGAVGSSAYGDTCASVGIVFLSAVCCTASRSLKKLYLKKNTERICREAESNPLLLPAFLRLLGCEKIDLLTRTGKLL